MDNAVYNNRSRHVPVKLKVPVTADDDFTLSSEDENSETENDIENEQAHAARSNTTSSKRITTYCNLCEGKLYFCLYCFNLQNDI